jgi:internalin A
MPTPPMTPEAQRAYDEALKRIQACLQKGKLGRLGTFLDLGGLGLTQVPPEIGQLSALRELRLDGNQLTSLPPEIGKLAALKELDLSNNQLTRLPPEFGQLSALRMLFLSNNQLTSLPSEIGQLAALTELLLYDNQLTSLPPEIGQLTALSMLNLSNNQLTSLPPEIGQLSALTALILYNNRLTTLPPEISQLSALKELHLNNNQLTILPPEIGQLSALTELHLNNNQLTSLPSQMGQLPSLWLLQLSDNQLINLAPEICRLSSLTVLYLSGNQFTSLPSEICELDNLERLVLENNALESLPETLNRLTRLKQLTLHGNDSLGLPVEVLGPTWRESGARNLPNNPRQILAFYFAQQQGKTRPLNEVKVLVVGESEVGKTSLIRQLRGEDHNPKQDKTHGIERHRVMMNCGRLGDVRLNVWDFGGQDIMHATHQFFLTHRSVYVLVLDSRQNERQTRIDYWLRLIASYGGDSPVIVVCNKADQQVMQLNWTALQRDYPQIKAFAKEVCCYHFEGCDRRQGLEELKQLIAQSVAEHVAEVDRPILVKWLDFKDELEVDGRSYLTLEQYHQEAAKRGITQQQDRELLLSLMHRLGSVLHFSEHAIFEQERAKQATPAHVEELNVLDPGWVTEAVYKLLNDPDLIRAGGRMDRGSMRASLSKLPGNRYPGTKKDFIIAMMRRFEICFAFDGEADQWFLPDLLHKDEVDTGDWREAMAFRYQYRVLPSSIMGRLMVRLHHYIARHCLWRTGAKFKQEHTEALVRSDAEEARVDIFIRGGTKRERQDFLALIRGTLEDIHRSFSGHLAVEELISIPKHPEVYVDYERLLLLEARGTPGDMVKVDGKLEGIEVVSVLNQVTDKPSRNAERRKLAAREDGKHKPGTTIIQVTGDYITGHKTMNTDDHSITIGRDNNGQVAQTMTNCQQMIQNQKDGELKTLLSKLEHEVAELLLKLPEEKREEAAGNLELLTKAVTSTKPNRAWYSVSSEGLLEASKYVKDFTGNIAGTLGSLTKVMGL